MVVLIVIVRVGKYIDITSHIGRYPYNMVTILGF